MRIISWNVNGLRATVQAGAFAPIAELAPDALCVQEVRTKEQPKVLPGYAHHFNPAEREGYSGTALVTAMEPVTVEDGLGVPDLDAEGRVITAEYPDLYLVNAYVPRSMDGLRRQDYRVRFNDALVEHVERLEDFKPVVLCGDFNAILDTDDVYAENIHHGEDEEGFASDDRDLLLELVDMGYVDAFRHVHPDDRNAFTWWSQRRNRRALNRGWRLDYFFVSEAIAGRIADARHLTDVTGSDHCPVLLDVAL